MPDMDGKKKLEELVANCGREDDVGTWKALAPSYVRSISDAFKAMEAERDDFRDRLATQCGKTLVAMQENERLRKQLAFSDEHASIARCPRSYHRTGGVRC